MNIYKKIANRFLKHASSVEYVRASVFNADEIVIDVKMGDEQIGEIVAVIKDYEIQHIKNKKKLSPCADDIYNLLKQEQSLIKENGSITVVEITNSVLTEHMRRQGIGYEMYVKMAQEAFKENNRKPFFLVPNYCSGETTSPEARRVWKSLARRYPSSGDVVVINK